MYIVPLVADNVLHRYNTQMDSIYENPKTSKQLVLEEHRTTNTIEKITIDGGIKLHIQGAQFPQKSCPTPEAVVAVNLIKKIVVSFLVSGVIPTSKNKLVGAFNKITKDVVSQHIIKDEYMTSCSRELKKLIYNFLINWNIDETEAVLASKTISHIFEYDNSYRYRLQDLFNETDKNNLFSPFEMIYLSRISYDRDDILSRNYEFCRRVGKQTLKMGKVVALMLCIPSIKRSLKKALQQCSYENFLMDDSDRYWSYLRQDYNFGGLTYDERMIKYKEWGFKLPKYD